jgi:hypothetical protein
VGGSVLPVVLALLTACTGEDAPTGPPECRPTLAVRADGVVLEGGDCGTLDLTATAVGDGDLRVALDLHEGTVVVRVASTDGGTLRGLVLAGPLEVAGDGPLRLWRQGYQSWSWSGVLDPVPLDRDAEGFLVAGGDGQAFATADETGATSWWVGLAGRPGGASAVVGALGASKTKFLVGFDDGELVAQWGGRGEAIDVPAGGEVELDPLFLGLDWDASGLLEDYADHVAAVVPPRPLDPMPPTGWGSWSPYFADVTEADVRATLAVIPDELDVVELDDGWETAWGDWSANAKFPSGTAALAADIRAAGHTPGLWMAPFYVDRSTAAYTDHPDWWVRDADGEELTFSNLGSGDYAIIDVTVPDAAAWMGAQVSAKADEGYGFLKLDFLYAGAVEGVRAEPITGTEAYHRGMDVLRAAAGDAFVLACGAPMLPSVGTADGFRTGADITFAVSPEPNDDFLRWQAKNTAARSWANGRWWWNDPDQLLVANPLTEVQARGSVASVAASGGIWLLGDDLTTLPADRLALATDPEALAARGGRPRPLDPLSFASGLDAGPPAEAIDPNDTAPTRWILGNGHEVLLNLGSAPVDVLAPPGTEALSGAATSGPTVRTLPAGDGEIWEIGG